MHQHQTSVGKGTALLLASSVGFSVLFFITPYTLPLSALEVAAIRIMLATPAMLLVFIFTKQAPVLLKTWRYIWNRKIRFISLLFCGLMLASQLWIFAYGPLSGRGIQVSLGYFMLPITLLLVGRFVFKDKLLWWHWLAVIFAAAGVVYEIVRFGGFSWEALWISLGYPLYFALRRIMGFATLSGMFWEFACILVPTIVVFAITLPNSVALETKPIAFLYAFLISAFATVVFTIWVLSSLLMPLSLFGLLSYVEPLLLLGAAILLGETIAYSEMPAYLAIWIAVSIVVAGSVSNLRKKVRSKKIRGRHRLSRAEKQREQDQIMFASTGSIPIVKADIDKDSLP
ncbi:EamA family transporter RarD [Canibacter sp. lx-45]|uniref:EamA family transporter n=1 Tax=Canibacter zhuwentaonis TaxID=2837491 RepID=UPI001BDDB3DD|nr:EamA family transporter RarD [Canibacter zhuwentaonis]MBT1035526.1 EamA family transporter RarD [Canibacter zhuwentaonis]